MTSISTNATAPNLPGPGRTIGLFYEFSGRLLERTLNVRAEKWGLGPQAAAMRIIKRQYLPSVVGAAMIYPEFNTLPYYEKVSEVSSMDMTRIENDCRRILRYATK